MVFLFPGDGSDEASLMNVSYRYLYTPKSISFASKGTHLTVGLNLARFFSKKIIFGVCYDLKQFKGFTKQHFSQNFIDDFNSNFIPTYANAKDSSRAYTLRDAINGTSGAKIVGNTFQNIGISFSPFPQKYGGFLLELKTGDRVFPIFGEYIKKYFTKDDGGYAFLQLNNAYSIELSFKPYKFFDSERMYLSTKPPKFKDLLKVITIGFYYEKLTFNGATFNGVAIDQIQSANFIAKYDNITNWGIKIGVALY